MEAKQKIICGNSLDLIKHIKDQSVQLLITSPPYFQQRNYTNLPEEIGKEQSIGNYIAKLASAMEEFVRVVNNEGSLIWNMGDKYIKNNLELIPYRFAELVKNKYNLKLINVVQWSKLNPIPRQHKKRLIPSHEPFFHFVKSNNYFYQLNHEKILPKKSPNLGKRYIKMVGNSDLTFLEKENALSEIEKSINQFNEGKITGFRMKIRGLHAPAYGGVSGGRNNELIKNGYTIIKLRGNKLQKDVWESSVSNIKNLRHNATFPQEIIEKFVKMTTREGDLVLDPFVGVGTTALACKKLNRNCIGFDLNEEFVKISNQRLL